MEGLFSVMDVENFNPKKVVQLHKKYLNSGLVSLLGFINFDRVYTGAKDCVITDSEGNQIIDFLGGYGSLNIGHNHSYVINALSKVKDKPNILQAGLNPYAAALAHNLSVLTGGALRRAFFCNSGAEAVEGALKLARAASGKSRLIFCSNSFHGKSFGALSVTGRTKYRRCFVPLLPDCEEVTYGNAEVLEERLRNRDVAAFIVEPVQGEGGIIVPPEGYLKKVRELCTHYEALLIIDEIQTGLGRTGKMFAFGHEDVVPDIMCLAKSLSGGIMPIGAYLSTEDTFRKAYGGVEKCMLHTSTFGGNTYSCTAALAALEVIIRDKLAEQALEKGSYLLQNLFKLKARYDVIREVRGKGLMAGIEFNNSTPGILNSVSKGIFENIASEYFASLVAGKLLNEYGILTAYTLNNPNVIRIEPPLTISYEQIDRLTSALDDIFRKNKGFVGIAVRSVKNLVK